MRERERVRKSKRDKRGCERERKTKGRVMEGNMQK